MLKIGVLGSGHLGNIHLKLLNQSTKYELMGFYDPNQKKAEEVQNEFGYHRFESIEKLIESVDVVDIVTPTLSHFECAKVAIKNNKHIFIEKPVTNTLDEAKELITLTKVYGVKAQVGHVERFNPAFLSTKNFIKNPMFIECHRLAEFKPRGTDVPVVLDLMIHDIDIILSVVNSEVKNISSSGIPVVSKTPDIANARIEFENGCIANLTTSRISLKTMRKTRFFQRDAYISVDFFEKKGEVVRMKNIEHVEDEFAMVLETAEGEKKQIYFENIETKENNAILQELESFAYSINNDTPEKVSLLNGKKALEVAQHILDKMSVK